MFNKMKNIASSLGNSMQRGNVKKRNKLEIERAIKITKLELTHNFTIAAYIHNTTDDPEFPGYIGKQALYRTVDTNEEEKNAKISFLKQFKIKTNLDDQGNVINFEKIDEKEIYKK